MKLLRASIVLAVAVSAKKASDSNENSPQRLRGPQVKQQRGSSNGRELFFGNGDGTGGLEALFSDGGLEETFGGFGGIWTGGTTGSGVDDLSDAIEDIVDSLADALGTTAGNSTGVSDYGDASSVLAQIADSFTEILEGVADVLEEGATAWNFTITDWGDGAVWSGTEAGSGVSVAGQVAGSFACPQTCSDGALCEAAFAGSADSRALAQACDAGCLPGPASCEDVCGASDQAADGQLPWEPSAVMRFIDFGAVTNMACNSCKFLTCCSEDSSPDSDSSKFESCQDYLPDVNDLLTDISDVSVNTGDIQDWVSSLAENMGLDLQFGGDLPSLLGEALVEFDSFALTCDQDSCPIDGLCGANPLNLVTLDFDDLCAKDAFFGCSEGLNAMCDDECGADGDDGDSDNIAKASFCTLCGIARCCTTSEQQGKSFQDCTMDALPEELVTLLNKPSISDVSIVGGTPVEEEALETYTLSQASIEASSTEDESTLADGYVNYGGPNVAASTSEPGSGSDLKVSRAEVQESASCVLRTATVAFLVLTASVASLLTSL